VSLIVSLRVPDGIVMAADSLSTTQGGIQPAVNVELECPHCHEQVKLPEVKGPPITIPTSTQPYTQKIFPFHRIYGVGAYGTGIINSKPTHYYVQALEMSSSRDDFDSTSSVARAIGQCLHGQLKQEIANLDAAPDDFVPLGLHVVGYDGEEGRTVEVAIGKEVRIEERAGIGATAGGDTTLATHLWNLSRQEHHPEPNIASFSLQDAVDYAEFLIGTTIAFQRFAQMIPTVGGAVDVGVITPFRSFTWLKQKELWRRLYEQEENNGTAERTQSHDC